MAANVNINSSNRVEVRFPTGHVMNAPVHPAIMQLLGENITSVVLGYQSWSQEKNPFRNLMVPPDKRLENDSLINLEEGREHKRPVIGMHTWAEHCDDIDQAKVMPMIDKFIEVKKAFEQSTGRGPEDNQYVFILDDGAVNQDIGEAVRTDRFPDISEIVTKLEDEGITPGIWWAPFWIKPGSKLSEEKPDLLMKNKNGSLVEKGFLDHGLFTKEKQLILDIANPEAKKYMLDKFDDLYKMGFRYFKMDFLYLLWDDPKRDIKEIDSDYIAFIQEIRELHPDVRLLGCGCPLHVSEQMDDLRVGSDSVFIQYERLMKSLGEFINNFNFDSMLKACVQKLVIPNINFDLDVLLMPSHGLSEEKISKWHDVLKVLTGIGRGNMIFGDNIVNMKTEDVVQKLIDLSGEPQIKAKIEP